MKKQYDVTLLFYIKTLKKQGIIKTWEEGSNIYFRYTNTNIVPNTLNIQSSKIEIENINLAQYFEYCKDSLKYKKEDEIKEKKENPNTLVKSLAITDEDLKKIFFVTEKDSEEEKNKKILDKIGDEVFLLTYLGFNPGIFEVKRLVLGSWTTPVKEEKNNEKNVIVILNSKFTIEIGKRKKELLFYSKEECDKYLEDFLSRHKITPFDIFDEKMTKEDKLLNDDLMIVCPGLELHLGKLGSIADFEDYSSKQAMWRVKKVAQELYKYQKLVKASTLLLGIGNDYFNSDTADDKTTAGTPQNNDTRFKENYLCGKISEIRFIESLKNSFNKTILKSNSGNHDEKTSFSLFSNLYDLYRLKGDNKVEIDLTYNDLRFTTCQAFGENLIVFSHGKSPQGKNLSDRELAIKIKEHFPNEYYKARRVYIFAGHLHQDSEYQDSKLDTKVTVIRTASLSGVDSWHYENNYLGNREGHSVYLIDKKRGYIGKYNITLTDEDKLQKISNMSRKATTNVQETMEKALNLTEKSIDDNKVKEELKILDGKIRSIRKYYLTRLKRICELQKIEFNDLTDEMKKELLNLIGYNEEVKELENHRQLILKYK